MFLCPKCHKKDEDICNGLHFGASRGRCEDCGDVADCVDCKAYKSLSLGELIARRNRYSKS